MYKKILVGVDGSENSNRALLVAAELCQDFDAELLVFHAVPHNNQIPTIIAPSYPGPIIDTVDLVRYFEDAGKAVIEDAKNQIRNLEFGPELKVDYHLELDASPEDFAIDYASDNEVDLIVLGCKGHHGRLRRVLLGTVATKIANDAPCQVLIVR